MVATPMDTPTPMADDQLVLVIAADDTWLHAGTASEVLGHAQEHRQQPSEPSAGAPAPLTGKVLDFFDDHGERLLPLVDGRLEVCGFAGGGGQVDPAVLRARIDTVLDRAQAHLERHPGGAGAGYPAMKSVPRPSGDLPEVIASLRLSVTESAHGHSAGWFHNLLHALG